jgi:hypothetical protein
VPGVKLLGIVATMVVDVKLVTDNGALFSVTAGVVLPKFVPDKVIFCVTKFTTALVTTGWFPEAAWTLPGWTYSAKASTATMSVNFEATIVASVVAGRVFIF